MAKFTKILIIFLTVPLIAEARNEQTLFRRGGGNFAGRSLASEETRVAEQIMCGFKANGIEEAVSNKQFIRAAYVSRYLSEVAVRIQPRWTDTEMAHLVAQAVAETGNLGAIVEGRSEYASSKSMHKGRGIIQLTHRANYAKFAGCIDSIDRNPSPGVLVRGALAAAPRIHNSKIVRNPTAAFSERSEEGKRLNALASICWLIDNSERHPKLKKNMQCSSDYCINQVGCGVNRGPGSVGKCSGPLNAKGRRDAFKRVKKCFPGINSVGV